MKKFLITFGILSLLFSFTAEAARTIKVCVGVRAWGVCIGVEVVVVTNLAANGPTNYTGSVSRDGKSIIINNLPSDATEMNMLTDFKYTKKDEAGKDVTILIKKGKYKVNNTRAALPVTVNTSN